MIVKYRLRTTVAELLRVLTATANGRGTWAPNGHSVQNRQPQSKTLTSIKHLSRDSLLFLPLLRSIPLRYLLHQNPRRQPQVRRVIKKHQGPPKTRQKLGELHVSHRQLELCHPAQVGSRHYLILHLLISCSLDNMPIRHP